MSRTATGAVLVSAIMALFLGPELGFGPITSTSRADERHRPVPAATVVIIKPESIAQATPPPPPPPPPPAPAPDRVSRGGARTRPGAAGSDIWARLRACESPTNGG